METTATQPGLYRMVIHRVAVPQQRDAGEQRRPQVQVSEQVQARQRQVPVTELVLLLVLLLLPSEWAQVRPQRPVLAPRACLAEESRP